MINRNQMSNDAGITILINGRDFPTKKRQCINNGMKDGETSKFTCLCWSDCTCTEDQRSLMTTHDWHIGLNPICKVCDVSTVNICGEGWSIPTFSDFYFNNLRDRVGIKTHRYKDHTLIPNAFTIQWDLNKVLVNTFSILHHGSEQLIWQSAKRCNECLTRCRSFWQKHPWSGRMKPTLLLSTQKKKVNGYVTHDFLTTWPNCTITSNKHRRECITMFSEDIIKRWTNRHFQDRNSIGSDTSNMQFEITRDSRINFLLKWRTRHFPWWRSTCLLMISAFIMHIIIIIIITVIKNSWGNMLVKQFDEESSLEIFNNGISRMPSHEQSMENMINRPHVFSPKNQCTSNRKRCNSLWSSNGVTNNNLW